MRDVCGYRDNSAGTSRWITSEFSCIFVFPSSCPSAESGWNRRLGRRSVWLDDSFRPPKKWMNEESKDRKRRGQVDNVPRFVSRATRFISSTATYDHHPSNWKSTRAGWDTPSGSICRRWRLKYKKSNKIRRMTRRTLIHIKTEYSRLVVHHVTFSTKSNLSLSIRLPSSGQLFYQTSNNFCEETCRRIRCYGYPPLLLRFFFIFRSDPRNSIWPPARAGITGTRDISSLCDDDEAARDR